MGYKTMLWAKRAENNFFLVCTPNCDILGYISRKVANEVKKNVKWICFGARQQSGGQLPLMLLRGYVTGKVYSSFCPSVLVVLSLSAAGDGDRTAKGPLLWQRMHGRHSTAVASMDCNPFAAWRHRRVECAVQLTLLQWMSLLLSSTAAAAAAAGMDAGKVVWKSALLVKWL